MRVSLQESYLALENAPEDWSIRLRLMEAAMAAGDLDEAKRLVRTSPDDGPLPRELQRRIHTLLTRPYIPADEEVDPSADGSD